MKFPIVRAVLTSLLLTSALFAQIPPLINYQGRVAVGNVNFDGTGQFKFALVDGGVNQNVQATGQAFASGGPIDFTIGAVLLVTGGSGYVDAPLVTITDATGTGATAEATVTDGVVTGIQVTNGGSGYSFTPTLTIAPPPPNIVTTTFWMNSADVNADGQPDDSVALPVTKGLYSVLLGEALVNNMLPIPASVFTTPDVRLRVWFDDGTSGIELLSPDQRLAPSAYLASGTVGSTAIAYGAVTSDKIAGGAINISHLVAGNPGPGQVLGYDGADIAWVAPGGADGIWTFLSGNAYRPTGNVGIGISVPTSKLDIAGAQDALRITAVQPFLTLRDSSAANARSVIASGGGALSLLTESYLANPNTLAFLKLANNGNVGIGSTTPVGKLEVVGQDALRLIGGQPFMTFYDTSSGLTPTRINSVAGRMNFLSASFLNNSNTSAFATLASNGNFGIGTNDPQGKLEIVAPQDALRIIGYQPFLTLFDSSAGFAGSRIQGVGGEVSLQAQSFVSQVDTSAYALLKNTGNFSVKTLTIRGGADLAEPFQMKEEELEKGSVVVIDDEHPGRLKRSSGAYDTRVAGIVSGANGVNPGIALHQEGVIEGGQNVSLSGRVYVQADATGASIKPGDLLTTSDTPGHAMKVTEHGRSQGAVIGKAMSSLKEGKGMVLVLVTLQ